MWHVKLVWLYLVRSIFIIEGSLFAGCITIVVLYIYVCMLQWIRLLLLCSILMYYQKETRNSYYGTEFMEFFLLNNWKMLQSKRRRMVKSALGRRLGKRIKGRLVHRSTADGGNAVKLSLSYSVSVYFRLIPSSSSSSTFEVPGSQTHAALFTKVCAIT